MGGKAVSGFSALLSGMVTVVGYATKGQNVPVMNPFFAEPAKAFIDSATKGYLTWIPADLYSAIGSWFIIMCIVIAILSTAKGFLGIAIGLGGLTILVAYMLTGNPLAFITWIFNFKMPSIPLPGNSTA